MFRKTTRGSFSPAHLKQSKARQINEEKIDGKRLFLHKFGVFSAIPNAEIGSSIVDDDGGGGWEEPVICLPPYVRYERHSRFWLKLGSVERTLDGLGFLAAS